MIMMMMVMMMTVMIRRIRRMMMMMMMMMADVEDGHQGMPEKDGNVTGWDYHLSWKK